MAMHVLAGVIVVMVLALLIRLQFKGMSMKMKKVIMKRHISYFVFYLIFIIHTFQHLFNTYLRSKWDDVVYYSIGGAFNSIGFFLAFVRFSEPYIWINFKADMRKLFCCKPDRANQRVGSARELLNSFLNSDMNTEYAYILLVGISFHLDPLIHLETKQNKRRIKLEQTNIMTKFTFHEVAPSGLPQVNVVENKTVSGSIN